MTEPEVAWLRLTAEEALRLPWIGIDQARVVIDPDTTSDCQTLDVASSR